MDSQAFVVTEDRAFFDAVAAPLRRVLGRPLVLRQVRESGALPATVGLQDLVIVDTRTCPGPIANMHDLPCVKITLNGTNEATMDKMGQALARSSASRVGHRRSELGARGAEATHVPARRNAARAGAGVSEDERERALLSFACRLATLKPEKINEACRQYLPGLVGARRVSGYLYVPAKTHLELAWRTGDEPIAERMVVSPFRTDSPTALAVNRRRAWYAENVDQALTAEGIATRRPYRGRYQSGACIVAPVVYGAELLGVVNFADPIDGGAFDRRELEPRLEGLTHLLAATWQSVGIVKSLEQLARTDGLTGLGNYRAFEETITREVTRARRYGLPLSLIMMDVDQLKQVNDRLGHPAGDLLLREVARRLAGAIRETDIAARQGGDEFSVILPNTALPAVQQAVARVEEAVNGVQVRWLQHVFESSVSIAVGQYDGQSAVSAFVEEVDARLYRGKPCPHVTT